LVRPHESFVFSIHLLRLSHPFCWWFPSLNRGYFRLEGICFCLGSFTMPLFWWPFEYGLWTFIRFFCLRWFCQCLLPLFWSMWVHCSRSCFTFSITFVLCILILNVGEAI
jgi:hypothetical protein